MYRKIWQILPQKVIDKLNALIFCAADIATFHKTVSQYKDLLFEKSERDFETWE